MPNVPGSPLVLGVFVTARLRRVVLLHMGVTSPHVISNVLRELGYTKTVTEGIAPAETGASVRVGKPSFEAWRTCFHAKRSWEFRFTGGIRHGILTQSCACCRGI